jgi:hypothetical protein
LEELMDTEQVKALIENLTRTKQLIQSGRVQYGVDDLDRITASLRAIVAREARHVPQK